MWAVSQTTGSLHGAVISGDRCSEQGIRVNALFLNLQQHMWHLMSHASSWRVRGVGSTWWVLLWCHWSTDSGIPSHCKSGGEGTPKCMFCLQWDRAEKNLLFFPLLLMKRERGKGCLLYKYRELSNCWNFPSLCLLLVTFENHDSLCCL